MNQINVCIGIEELVQLITVPKGENGLSDWKITQNNKFEWQTRALRERIQIDE